MFEQARWSKWALPTLLSGWVATLLANSVLVDRGVLLSLPLLAVAVVMLSTGGGQLIAPGDRRLTQLGAFAGFVGAILALPYALIAGPAAALTLFIAGLASVWGSGRMALHLEPHTEGVPVPSPTVGVAAKVAVDELILGFEQVTGSNGYPLDGTIERVVEELGQAHQLFTERGLVEKPAAYHERPPDLTDPEIRVEEISGHRVQILRFESGYAPAEGEPGRDRWLGYDACRDGWAYVLQHDGPPRPWVIATNGYRMGHARIDVSVFERFFHDGQAEGDMHSSGLGLNVLIPVLPLHGPRRLGWHSGSGFLGVDVMDTIHAETQALWDMRRLLSWIRTLDAPAVGAFGLSLGGLTTANFASVADGLVAAIPGIPLTAVSRVVMRHAAPHQVRYAESLGYRPDQIDEVFRVISPLALEPQVPHAGRMIFGATADRLVTPDHVRDLWRHWDEPEIVWYDGSHISFANERRVWAGVDRTLRESGLSN